MKVSPIGEFEELVLLIVAAQHDEAYGVSIYQHITQEMKRAINISGIHVALNRMEDKGLVKSRYGGITEEQGGRRKKFYVITALGKKVLDQQYAVRARLYNQIPKISFGR